MTHFPPSDWVDLVHQKVLPAREALMKEHLERACVECQQAMEFWKRVQAIGMNEALRTPPADVVAAAKASFKAPMERTPWSAMSAFAELVFDSALQPAMAGVRSGAAGARRMLYRSGRHSVDLSIERSADAKMMLIGQVLDSSAPTPEMPGVQVRLSQKEKVLSITETSKTGVFWLQCESDDDLEIALSLEHEKRDLVLMVSPGRFGKPR
jgi:hypothetical protein